MGKITYSQVKANEEINLYIAKGNEMLAAIGYTDHSKAHAAKVAETAGMILRQLNYSEEEIELAMIAGYMHDIGNCVNRNDHAHNGALLARQLLKEMGMEPEDIVKVISAIGQHDERTGTAVDVISAALILADKTDVRRNRVQNKVKATFDIHDRVNYAAVSSNLIVDTEKKVIRLEMELDEEICSIMDYFEIFLGRMTMCKRAAEVLGMRFKFTANGSKVC
ncbi:MAG: HD domain-containing protein [Lachnospiraceae bacterium]|nr:HD domain-containing protein [Lachnospiraceae bacterium]